MNEFLVSIIIPTYNAEKTLPICLNSILPQLDSFIEVIVVNDGSKDDTWKICEEYAKKNSQIIVINKQNEGVSSARNDAMNIARGKWLMFVDSDDKIINDIKKCINNLPDECNLVLMGEVAEYETYTQQEIRYRDAYYPSGNKKKLLEEQPEALFGHAGPWAKFFRTDVIRKYHICFNEHLSISEDRLFHYDYCEHIEGVQTLSMNIYSYWHSTTGLRTKIYSLEEQKLRISKITESSVRLLKSLNHEEIAYKKLRQALNAQCGAAIKALPDYCVLHIIREFSKIRLKYHPFELKLVEKIKLFLMRVKQTLLGNMDNKKS